MTKYLTRDDITLVKEYLEALRDEGWNDDIIGFLNWQIEKLEASSNDL